jgi:anti-anti-sigma factor
MQLFHIEFVDGASPPVLKVMGEVDLASAGELRRALEQALAVSSKVVVDMGGVTFIDAAGLRALLEVADTMNGSGPLTLAHAPRVARLLDLVGLRGLPSIDLRDSEATDG